MKMASDYVKDGWAQGAAARDKNGLPVHPSFPGATCWCLIGALEVAYNDRKAVSAAMNKLYSLLGDCNIAAWNDNNARNQQEVVNILQQAGL